MSEHEIFAALSIVFLSLISEDAAVVGGALLAVAGGISWSTAILAGFVGVWMGDLVLYVLARLWGRKVVDRLLRGKTNAGETLVRSEAWFHRHGWLALVFCRMIPATRLPTYLTAGLLKMPAGRFALITALLAFAWVFAVMEVVKLAGNAAPGLLEMGRPALAATGVALFLVVLLWWNRCAILQLIRKSQIFAYLAEWEFWPPWIFYLPLAVWYLVLSVRHRSLSLPTCANPGMFTGGMIGESKIATLLDLENTSPEWVAAGFLIPPGTVDVRVQQLSSGMASRGLSFPVVLKPDVGQRGSGFQIVRSAEAAREVFSAASEPLIAQEYLPGPMEAGVFYFRFPGSPRGKIFSTTKKIFPVVVGDGKSTVETLILSDPRARRLSRIYLERLRSERHRIPLAGETVKLVNAGNHAQGCIFQDGTDWTTAALELRIDKIAQRLTGFFVGRFDVRFSNADDFKRGEGFRILELNGAASEATSAYDANHSLLRAYSILFEQWRLVFAIGAANRRAGVSPTPWPVLLREWRSYQRLSEARLPAD